MKNILREHFGLEDAALSPIATGAVNLNLRVDAPGGSYVLKRYDTRYYQADEVRRTIEIQAGVGRRGVAVPAVIPNRVGDLLTLAEDGLYVLFAFVPGRHHRRAEGIPGRAALAMGETLGRLVHALRELLPTEPFTPPDPTTAIARIEEILRAAERGTEALDRVASQNLRAQLGAVDRLGRQARQFAGLEAQWVHGDYQDTNVLFDADDQVVAVVDFDNLRVRPRAWEMMRALAFSFPPGSGSGEEFFRGYSRIVQPDPDEVALCVPLWAYVSATRTWPLEQRYLQPSQYQPRWDSFIQPRTDWWERHAAEMTSGLLTIAAEERQTVR